MAAEMSYTGLSNTGFDYDAYLAKLADLKSIPIKQLQQQQTKILAKKTAILDIKTSLSALSGPASKLQESEVYDSIKGYSSNSDVASVSVSQEAVEGSYDLEVIQKARSNSFLVSPAVTVTDPAAVFEDGGALHIDYLKDGSQQTLSIDYTGKTLEDIMKQINESEDLQATLVNLGTAGAPDYRLFVRSLHTGTQNAITSIRDSDADDTKGFDVSSTATYQTQAAQDAKIKLDGIEFVNSTDTFDGILRGVDITAKDVGTTTIRVEKDFGPIENALKKVVQYYNELKDAIENNLAKGQPLQGETSLYSIADALYKKISNVLGKYGLVEAVGEGEFATGKLKLNTERLHELLQDKTFDAKKIFGDFGREIESIVNLYSDNLSTQNQRYDNQSARLDREIETKTKRLQEELAALRKRYVKLNTYLNKMKSLQSTLQAYIASFNSNEDK
jgi:flagellar hook-associated protein 2